MRKSLEPYIREWIHYYGRFRISALNPVFQLLRQKLVWWARKWYKRYKTSLSKAYRWLERIRAQFPGLYFTTGILDFHDKTHIFV